MTENTSADIRKINMLMPDINRCMKIFGEKVFYTDQKKTACKIFAEYLENIEHTQYTMSDLSSLATVFCNEPEFTTEYEKVCELIKIKLAI